MSNPDFVKSQKIKNPKKKLKRVHDICKGIKVCRSDDQAAPNSVPTEKLVMHHGCGGAQPHYKRELTRISVDFKNAKETDNQAEKKKVLTAEEVLYILKQISDEDSVKLGMNPEWCRPDWLITSVLPVPPPAVRPSVVAGGGAQRGEDDLTHKLAEIVKFNNQLRKQELNGAPRHILLEFTSMVQQHYISYINNDVSGRTPDTRNGRPIKSIRQRIKGKEGRIRNNLMGKRVDFSARTVITPDPTLEIDQVGVPRSIARNLTYPEIVTPFNIERLKEMVHNGPEIYPGAKYIIRDDGQRVDLRYTSKTSDTHLEYGYRVERHLQDDDLIIFNRQPSLHKMSMMGHRVKVLPYSTFRLNLSVTTPYNADFDGDEMNMHVPQSLETRAEVLNIMMVPRQIVAPASNKPCMGIVQDTLLGCRLFTSRNTFLERDLVMNMLMWLPSFDGNIPVPAILKPKPLWTGKQLFSMFIPNVNLMHTANGFPDEEEVLARQGKVNHPNYWISPSDTKVKIEQGEIICGMIDKKTVGNAEGSLIHIIFNEHGHSACKAFLGLCQRMINYWMLQHGFTIGIGDTIADTRTMHKIVQATNSAKQTVKELIFSSRKGELKLMPGNTFMQSFENQVNSALNSAVASAGSAAQKSLKGSNNIKTMVLAGSKGSSINISQIIACVGQQNVEGKRIPFGFKGRTLPHFTKDDYGPESRGFVQNSYLRGLTPQEFFFHAMSGREGIIDTACKTSETGYIQRRLVKAMEDICVQYDQTVRNSLGQILQFLYGEDGMDGMWVEKQRLESMKLNDEAMRKKFMFNLDAPDFGAGYMEPSVAESVQRNADHRQTLAREFRALIEDRKFLRDAIPTGDDSWPLPLNLKRLIWNAQKTFHIDMGVVSDLNPADIVRRVDELGTKLSVVPLAKTADAIGVEANKNATALFQILLRSTLASKRVLSEYHLTSKSFEWLLGEIENRFHQSMIQPGEMVGAIAAQSIGEPATQMTLNTFHFAGVSSKNVTLGVPRLKEIINVAKKTKTPSLTIFLHKNNARDQDSAKAIQRNIEHTTLGKVTACTEIYYDPLDPHDIRTCIAEDQEFVKLYYEMPNEDNFSIERLSPWLLRIELDRKMMWDKQLNMQDITDKIFQAFGSELHTMSNDDNADKLIMRIRIFDEDEKNPDSWMFMKKVNQHLGGITLRGIEGIRKVFMREANRVNEFTPEGGYCDPPPKEWVLDTEGIGLAAVMACPGIDHTRTMSNDIVEVIQVLGIEAVRGSLLRELRTVISFDGSYVNHRHLATLCDVMTYLGYLIPITRHGINRIDTGPLMRSSFEESAEILLAAGAYSETDNLKGVTENIMLGQLAPVGTGFFDLFINEKMLEHAIEQTADIGNTTFLAYPEQVATSGSGAPFSPSATWDESHTPYNPYSPSQTPYDSSLSPKGDWSPAADANFSPGPSFSPGAYSPGSPSRYNPTSPSYSMASPKYGGAYSPSSPSYSPSSPSYSPSSPSYSPSSPSYSPSSPSYSPSSPSYSPSSPSYSPSSPSYSPSSPSYSPASPSYSPASPSYSPASPSYSPASPSYSPASPSYSPASPSYSPASPSYSPASPSYSPSSPSYSPASPSYSPSEKPKK